VRAPSAVDIAVASDLLVELQGSDASGGGPRSIPFQVTSVPNKFSSRSMSYVVSFHPLAVGLDDWLELRLADIYIFSFIS
jgi:hypothetical protein